MSSIELGSLRGLPLTFAFFIQHEAFIALKAAFIIVLLAFSDIDCGKAILATYTHKLTAHGWQGVSVNLGQFIGDVVVNVSRGGDGRQRGREECDFHCIYQYCKKIILIKLSKKRINTINSDLTSTK